MQTENKFPQQLLLRHSVAMPTITMTTRMRGHIHAKQLPEIQSHDNLK